MNILYLCDEYPPGRHGGIGTIVQLLARQMVQQGHTVVVAGFYDWGYGGADHFVDEGVQVYRFRRGLNSGWFTKKESLRVRASYKLLDKLGLLHKDIAESLPKYRAFVEDLIAKYDIDIAERPDFNEYVLYARSYIAPVQLSVPTVVKLHGSLTYFLREAEEAVPANWRRMEHDLLAQSTTVASVSRYTAQHTGEYLQYKADIQVLHNGIDTKLPDYPFASDSHKVIFSGSLAVKKGVYQLMKAWNIVHRAMPSASLWIYGKGPVARVQRLLDADAMKSVHFKGHVARQELFKEIAGSALTIFPSYVEAFAMAPMEAMALGAPVIFTTRSSGPELVTDGVNGLLTDPDDVQGMAGKILSLLQDPQRRRQLGENGRAHVRQHLDISVIGRRHEAYYATVLANAALSRS